MKTTEKHTLKHLLKICWSASPVSSVVTLLQYAVEGVSDSLILLFLGMFINEISVFHGNDIEATRQRIIFYLILLSVFFFSKVIFQKFSQVVREKQIFAVQQYFDKLICKRLLEIPNDVLDTQEFQDEFRIINETNSKLYMFISYIAQIFSYGIQLIMPLILLTRLSPWLLLPCLAFMATCVVLTSRTQFYYWSGYFSKTPLRRKRDYFLSLLTGKDSLAIIKSYQAEPFVFDKTDRAVKEAFTASKDIVFQQNNRYIRLQMLVLVMPVLIAVFAVFKCFQGDILVGDVITYLGLGQTIHFAIMSLGAIIRDFHTTHVSLQAIYSFLFDSDKTDVAHPMLGEQELPDTIESIRVRNLTFYYPGATQPALKNLSLEITAGKRTAIVGENGSGKTTLVKILLGLYKRYEGDVLINGMDLRSFSSEWLAQKMAPCFQDFLCPKFLLREAVGLSSLSQIHHDAWLNKALSDTNGQDILEQLCWDTQLGTEFHDGVDLSIGQWQKVALARTYFGKKEAVLLDEPLAAMDIYSEKVFFDVLTGKKLEQPICIFISHRMLGIQACDEIFVLDNGELRERGNHTDLIKARGKYYDLFSSQAMFDQDGKEDAGI